jgi:ABC-2 type transport system permease protein
VKEIFRAALVIGRRDFTAIIFSKAFIFFLLGPLFPVLVGVAAGSLGGQIAKEAEKPVIGLALSQTDSTRLLQARKDLSNTMGESYFTEMKVVGALAGGEGIDPKNYLKSKNENLSVVVTGTLDALVVTGTKGAVSSEEAGIALLAGFAKAPNAVALPKIRTDFVVETANNDKQLRTITGQAGQVLIFMLTMLLAGMVLSNLVEEKANKIIEILAASIPMESVFLGKLFAMLAMSFLGIIVWGGVGYGVLSFAGQGLPDFPTPAVGWPIFLGLGVIYFALAYLMLGALFLGIGAMAATVREVQTLSMPVTMLQLINFFFASYTVTKMGEPIEQIACIFPFSSPFAMIARAAQEPTLWHHGVAFIGQIAFAALLLRVGVYLFKRNVMKSGSGGKIKGDGKRKLFGLIPVRG